MWHSIQLHIVVLFLSYGLYCRARRIMRLHYGWSLEAAGMKEDNAPNLTKEGWQSHHHSISSLLSNVSITDVSRLLQSLFSMVNTRVLCKNAVKQLCCFLPLQNLSGPWNFLLKVCKSFQEICSSTLLLQTMHISNSINNMQDNKKLPNGQNQFVQF